MLKLKESVIVRHILEYLKYQGVAGKVKTMGVKRNGVFCYDPFTFRGFPDICAFINVGKDRYVHVYFEVKSGSNKQSPEQHSFDHLCSMSGIRYYCVRSLEEVEAIVKDIKEILK